MEKHPRRLIREAVAKQLRFKTAAVERVFETREVPWKRAELPGIAVYALEESSEPDNLQGDLRRSLTLAVLAVVLLTEDVDDAVDAIALEIENAMAADTTAGGTASSVVLSSTAIDVVDEQGRMVGVARLTFDVRYYTAAPE